jgi:biopolymer transport protein ExbB
MFEQKWCNPGIDDAIPRWRRILPWAMAGLVVGCMLCMIDSTDGVAFGQNSIHESPGAFDNEADAEERTESLLVWLCNGLGFRYIFLFFFLSLVAGLFFLISVIFSILGVTCPDALVAEIRGLLSQRNCPEVAAIVANRSSYLAKLLRAALKNPQMNSFHARCVMQRTQEYEQAKVRNYIRSFGAVGVLFFLAGLSGFFDGAIMSFAVIAKSSTAPKPSELATGVSMSLIAPFVGLTLAWWTFIFHWIVRNCYERFSARANVIAEELLVEFYTAAGR